MHPFVLRLTFLACLLHPTALWALEPSVFGNVRIDEVSSIYDGDTLRVTIRDWPAVAGQRVPVRVYGIDTPEMRDKRPRVRELAPTLPLLIPGVGAQGGDAEATVRAGLRVGPDGQVTGPIIVNSSRAVLYASRGDDFASAARQVAQQTRQALNAARLPT